MSEVLSASQMQCLVSAEMAVMHWWLPLLSCLIHAIFSLVCNSDFSVLLLCFMLFLSKKANQFTSLTRWCVKLWPLWVTEPHHNVSLFSYLRAAKLKRSHSRADSSFQRGTFPYIVSSFLSHLPKAKQGQLTPFIIAAAGLSFRV